MTKEEMLELIVDFKDNKRAGKKMPINVTLDEARIKRIYQSLAAKNDMFHFLNKSEKLDLCLYFLERFMQNSPMFSIQNPGMNIPEE